MVEGGDVRRDAGRATADVELGTLQREVARQVADIAVETIEHGRRHRVRRPPPGRDDCWGTRVHGGSDEADPFGPSLALGHPGFAGSEHEGPATPQIHPLQVFWPQPPTGFVGCELQPRFRRIARFVLAVPVDPYLAMAVAFEFRLQRGESGTFAVQLLGAPVGGSSKPGGRRTDHE